ncbi:MAG: sugar phosphate isomerase/epimerase [Planctomycetota bacterium]
MSDPKIALQLYNLRDSCATPAAFAATLRKVACLGYRCVQLAGTPPMAPKEVKALLDDCRLLAVSSHVGYADLASNLDSLIETHKLWNCPALALGGLPNDMRNPAGYRAWAREGSRIARRLREAGLSLSYHNHYWELEKTAGCSGMDILFEESDPDCFLFEIDTYWIQYAGGDPPAWIRRMAARVPSVHFKDMGIAGDKQVYLEVGEGNLNWPAILDACRESDVRYAVFEQDTSLRDPFESARISLANLQAMGLEP